MGVATYLLAATPPRLAVSGATIAVTLLAVERLGDVALGGLLALATLGPSLVTAPIVGVVLDRTRHPGVLIAGAGLLIAAGFAVAASLGSVPLWGVVIALIIAGSAAPFVMGGLSSFVVETIADERRAYAVDALAYNLGSVGGPAVVAAAAAFGSTHFATAILVGCAVLGAIGAPLLGLPPATRNSPDSIVATIVAGIRHIATHRPLAIITASGTLSQFGAGGLAIAAVALALNRGGDPVDGAINVTAFAIGGLVGAIWGSARPSRRRPETQMGFGFAAAGVLTIFASLNLDPRLTTLLIGAAGLFMAPSFAALLLMRKQQSPRRLRSQIFTVGAGLRASAGAAGAALAGIAAGVVSANGGEVVLLAIGVTWIASGAMLLAYPRAAPAIDGV